MFIIKQTKQKSFAANYSLYLPPNVNVVIRTSSQDFLLLDVIVFFEPLVILFLGGYNGIYILKDWANISFSPAPSDVPTEGKIYLQAITCVDHSKYTTFDLVDTIFATCGESSGDRHRNLHRVHCLH